MIAALRPCATPLCAQLVTRGHCRIHARARESQRPNVEIRKLYHTARWRHLRAAVLRDEPLCADCTTEGQTTVATEVDHKKKHGGDLALFFDRGNLQGLCATHHARKTQRGE